MKRTIILNTSRARRAVAATILATALAAPAVRAQTAEEFKQLKALVEQMQKTIESQNARIAELEKSKAAPLPSTLMPGVAEETSASIRTLMKIAGGEPVGQQSPVTYRGALNDQQEAASRPKDFTLDPKYQGFIPVPNTPRATRIGLCRRVFR
jgi:hypothetical protein